MSQLIRSGWCKFAASGWEPTGIRHEKSTEVLSLVFIQQELLEFKKTLFICGVLLSPVHYVKLLQLNMICEHIFEQKYSWQKTSGIFVSC